MSMRTLNNLGSEERNERDEQTRLSRHSLRDQVRSAVIDLVLNGELPAGERINESELARRLGVSQTPVREALLSLEGQSFLTAETGKGFQVRGLNATEVQEIYPVLATLESAALESAAPPSRDALAELTLLNEEFIGAGTESEHAIDLDNRWHRKLLARCPSDLDDGAQVVPGSRDPESAAILGTKGIWPLTQRQSSGEWRSPEAAFGSSSMFLKRSKSVAVVMLIGMACAAHSRSAAGEPADGPTISNPRFAPVRSIMLRGVRQGHIPSASIAVAKDGEIIWQESLGWADKERKRQATPHTMYALASISKPMTATGIMVLAQQKKIAIDDPIGQYIAPAKLTVYAGSASDVTIRHLLNHTSGLPTHYNYFYEDEPVRPPSIEETIRRYGILVHPPGKLFQYANLGYGILGHIIAKVSGKPLDEAMRELVFQPLEMPHTSVGIRPEHADLIATKYGPGKRPVPVVYVDTPGSAAVYSCAHDLARFGMFHLKDHLADQEQILKDDIIDAMHSDYDKSAAGFDKSGGNYALGWAFKKKDNGYGTVWHSGGMEGAGSVLKLVPSEHIAVAVLLNVYDRQNSWEEALMLADAAIGVLLPDFEKKSRAQSSGDHAEKMPGRKYRGTWKGEIKTHESSLPIVLEFQRDGDVHVSLDAQFDCTWGFLGHPTHHLLLNNVRIERNRFMGWAGFRLPTADAQRHPHFTFFELVLEGNILRGFATAYATTPRMYWGISSYTELTKVR